MPFYYWVLVLIFALFIDGIDFLFGWLPVVGTGLDVMGTIFSYALLGPMGLIYVWEVVAIGPGNAVDGFVPTMTIICFLVYSMGYVKPYKPIKRRIGYEKRK